MATRVLLADDHELLREGLKSLLAASEFEVVAEAANGHDAIRLAREHHPDVVVLDLGMPGLNGLEAARAILRDSPRCRVLVLTMHQDPGYLGEAMRAGARGYVLKGRAAAELLEALREVARGEVYLSSGLSREVAESLRSGDPGGPSPLTQREREVLQLIAEGKSTKEVAAALFISVKTADSHRQRIMSKLDIHETASLVRYAIRHRVIQA